MYVCTYSVYVYMGLIQGKGVLTLTLNPQVLVRSRKIPTPSSEPPVLESGEFQ